MALRKPVHELPKDAIKLNEEEATLKAWQTITEWENKNDTWALLFGAPTLSIINALSGAIINNHFRKKLKLGKFGFYSSVIPITVMPALITLLFHRHSVSTSMLLMKLNCPVCYEVRAAGLQIAAGFVYPMLIAPTTALMLSNKYATSRAPELTEGPKVMFRYLKKIVQPFHRTLSTIFIVQLVSSLLITHFELRNHFTVQRKIIELDESTMENRKLFQ